MLPGDGAAPPGGPRAIHHLSADGAVLRCAPSDPADPIWWRVVLDSVLFTVALLRGYEALHAGAIVTPGGGDGAGALAITAASGGGKSTLLAELLGRGLPLLADDVVVLESRGADTPPLAHPAAPLMTVPAARTPALFGKIPTAIGEDPAPAGETRAPAGETRAPAGETRAPAGETRAPAGETRAPAGETRAPAGETRAPTNEAVMQQAICAIEDEQWIAVPVHPEPLPLRALVVLDRRPAAQLPPGPRPALRRIEDPLAPLLGSLMAFPTSPERQRARFELASTLTATTALWRLTADLATPPDALADALLAGAL